MITASVEPGFVVIDSFVGSGSSAVAALKAGCTFIGADIAERAVSIAQWRAAMFATTGNDPLEGDHRLPLPRGLQVDDMTQDTAA
jgi:methylase of polypeptide subunit release factors